MRTGTRYTVARKPLQQTKVPPLKTRPTGDGAQFLDFGRAAFGTLLVPVRGGKRRNKLVVHLGEQLNAEGRLERVPAGSIRYVRIEQELGSGPWCRITIPPDKRNTGPAAIRMPAEIGEVLPFRYAEIESAEGIDAAAIRQVCVHYPFNDDASSFESSSRVLNAVWDLCKYSIKATTFCGVYVDGDRERIPYEGDAYINQLGHYCVDSEYALARYTHEYLIQNPTWPTEWHLHSVMMAWADYVYTGETTTLEAFFDELCAKTLIDFARQDGLISTAPERRSPEIEARLAPLHSRGVLREDIRDIVDWPPAAFTDGGTGERDNHEMLPVNTVVNAFHCHALTLMSRIARVLDRIEDQARFSKQANLVRASINRLLFDQSRGVYVDGEGSRHASLHSNMFMLAFGLVPDDRRSAVVSFVKSRGMACSVYGAQHLLEALYRNAEDKHALDLMTATHDRSWWNMIRVGSTMTLEAWDLKYKNNLDWNHAWGAAPANIIPRFVLGVRPLEPGFRKVVIQPQPGSLERISGTVPTRRGPIAVSLEANRRGPREMRLVIPAGTAAKVGLGPRDKKPAVLVVDGKKTEACVEDGLLFLAGIGPGSHVLLYE